MATSSYAKSLLGGLGAEFKAAVGKFAEYVFDRNLEFGPVGHQEPCANFRGIYVSSTTAATANQEFTVAHGLGRTPNVIWQVADPRSVNTRFLGDLTISRAADLNRLYFTSASTSAAFHLYVE